MKISKLIEMLQEAHDGFGDIRVFISQDEDLTRFSELEEGFIGGFIDKDSYFAEIDTEPKCFGEKPDALILFPEVFQCGDCE